MISLYETVNIFKVEEKRIYTISYFWKTAGMWNFKMTSDLKNIQDHSPKVMKFWCQLCWVYLCLNNITSVNLLSKWHPSEQCQPVLVKEAPIHTSGNTTGKLHPHLITICLFYFRVYVCVPVWVSGYDVHTFPIWLWANNVGTGTRTPGTWKSRMYS